MNDGPKYPGDRPSEDDWNQEDDKAERFNPTEYNSEYLMDCFSKLVPNRGITIDNIQTIIMMAGISNSEFKIVEKAYDLGFENPSDELEYIKRKIDTTALAINAKKN